MPLCKAGLLEKANWGIVWTDGGREDAVEGLGSVWRVAFSETGGRGTLDGSEGATGGALVVVIGISVQL
jgi:hypothetical protein